MCLASQNLSGCHSLPPHRDRAGTTCCVRLYAYRRFCSGPPSPLQYMDCCLGFFGFLRSWEFTWPPGTAGQPLLVSDIVVDALDNLTMVRVHIWRAKADPFGKGVAISLGRKNRREAVPRSYIAVRPQWEGLLLMWGYYSLAYTDQWVCLLKYYAKSNDTI